VCHCNGTLTLLKLLFGALTLPIAALHQMVGVGSQPITQTALKPPFVERFIVAADARIIWVFQAN
jgi:hypothetical protein